MASPFGIMPEVVALAASTQFTPHIRHVDFNDPHAKGNLYFEMTSRGML